MELKLKGFAGLPYENKYLSDEKINKKQKKLLVQSNKNRI